MRIIKRISAFLILVSFFLPLTQCTSFMLVNPKLSPKQQEEVLKKEAANPENQINMAKSFKYKNIGSWLLLLAFVWPILIALIQEKSKNNIYKILVISVPIFCVITIYYIGQILMLGRPLYGGYIWVVAMCAFTIISFIEVFKIKSKSNKSLSSDAASGAG